MDSCRQRRASHRQPLSAPVRASPRRCRSKAALPSFPAMPPRRSSTLSPTLRPRRRQLQAQLGCSMRRARHICSIPSTAISLDTATTPAFYSAQRQRSRCLSSMHRRGRRITWVMLTLAPSSKASQAVRHSLRCGCTSSNSSSSSNSRWPRSTWARSNQCRSMGLLWVGSLRGWLRWRQGRTRVVTAQASARNPLCQQMASSRHLALVEGRAAPLLPVGCKVLRMSRHTQSLSAWDAGRPTCGSHAARVCYEYLQTYGLWLIRQLRYCVAGITTLCVHSNNRII